jgi:hypothetical protein
VCAFQVPEIASMLELLGYEVTDAFVAELMGYFDKDGRSCDLVVESAGAPACSKFVFCLCAFADRVHIIPTWLLGNGEVDIFEFRDLWVHIGGDEAMAAEKATLQQWAGMCESFDGQGDGQLSRAEVGQLVSRRGRCCHSRLSSAVIHRGSRHKSKRDQVQ